ncbi:type 1 glutamine amidotransferase domain-containing protein [Rhodovulum sulfidophilum]|uniref:type 1 glutamine amidotransferase domain-containing protein n=1 Tax=Rhodovulum sulfidophilum TaxID=35806 RepID=UPI0009523253|nr:type 1 glutamine amidotransferase domain-containing protein [Rhodovulum sulfidophilum]MBL3554034.1 type 1 glutamine amidotransferase [Rhodovulum sulfidophilum]OLS48004.1 protease [Rhodovulum sulfidophilum]
MTSIAKSKILIMATDGFEQSELEVPLTELRAKGAQVDIASPGGAPITGWKNRNWGTTQETTKSLTDVRVQEYDALVLPGGQMNPDSLRVAPEAVRLVRDFVSEGRIVAAICHGPVLLVEAGAVEGRKMTSCRSIRTDLRNAGAIWVDETVVTSNGIVTSRAAQDLGAFVAKIVEEIEEGRHSRRAA